MNINEHFRVQIESCTSPSATIHYGLVLEDDIVKIIPEELQDYTINNAVFSNLEFIKFMQLSDGTITHIPLFKNK